MYDTKEDLKKRMRNLYFTDDIRLDYGAKYDFIFNVLSDERQLISKSELMMLFVAFGYEKSNKKQEIADSSLKDSTDEMRNARFQGEAKTTFLSVGFDNLSTEGNELNMEYLNERNLFLNIAQDYFEIGVDYVIENFLESYEFIQEKDGVKYLAVTEKNETVFLKEFMTFVLGEIMPVA